MNKAVSASVIFLKIHLCQIKMHRAGYPVRRKEQIALKTAHVQKICYLLSKEKFGYLIPI